MKKGRGRGERGSKTSENKRGFDDILQTKQTGVYPAAWYVSAKWPIVLIHWQTFGPARVFEIHLLTLK